MNIINNLKKYKIVYIALIASLYLTAGTISELGQKQDIKTRLKNNVIIKSIYNLATKIKDFAKTTVTKTKKKSKSDIIIDETTKKITIELKQATEDIAKILDATVAEGKLKLGNGLKLRSQCKKKIIETTDNLEEIINETIAKLETHDEDKNLLIKNSTDTFIEEAKQEVSDVQNSMSTEMRKALGKKPEVVFDCTDKAKNHIAKFEGKVITKIEEFNDKLKADIQSKQV